MVVQYHPDTDMLYIKLADGVSTESEEVAPGMVLDFDAGNRVIGIEIEDARPLSIYPGLKCWPCRSRI